MCDLRSSVFTDAIAIRQPNYGLQASANTSTVHHNSLQTSEVITEKLILVDDWLTPDRMSSMPQRSVEAYESSSVMWDS
jgi:hypothetical protein